MAIDPALLPLFVVEAREHLATLNVALSGIERDGVDEAFRAVHSLKAASAAMGFSAMAAVAHGMEDVLAPQRSRAGAPQREVADTLLACADALEAALDAVADSGEERLDPRPLQARLATLVREGEGHRDPNAAPRGVAHLVIDLDEAAAMPGARAALVLAALAGCGDVIASEPSAGALEGFHGRTIEAWVACDDSALALDAARAVPEVAMARLAVAPEDETEGAAAVRLRGTAGTWVRIDTFRLDVLLSDVSLLLARSERLERLAGDDPDVRREALDLACGIGAVHEQVVQLRMVPASSVLAGVPRVVRDLAGRLAREVDLELSGQDTEVDRAVLDVVADPLLHLVRNALDHGIESPEEREAAGKLRAGKLEVAAHREHAELVLTVRDDGRGVQPARVAARAVEQGLLDPDAAAELTPAGAAELLFTPGLSTAERVTEVSGRGVGLDIVRARARELGGEATLRSEPGRGTAVEVRLPARGAGLWSTATPAKENA